MDENRSELLSPAEVAAHLNVTKLTIYRAIERGELPAVRLGARGPLRVSRTDLDSYMRPAARARP